MKKQLLTLLVCSSSLMAFSQNLPVSQSVMNKNAVLEELTGINCTYCPDGHKRANNIAAANPGRVILVNIHAGGYANATPDYRTAAGTAIDGFFNPTGYPAGGVQRTPHASDMARIATGRGNWQGQVNTVLGQTSPVNVALNATIDAETRVVTVTVETYYTSPYAPGTNHYLNVGILQDDLESQQVGASAFYPEMIQENGLYQHKHMFRGFVNDGGTWGDVIDASSTGVITRTYTYTLPTTIGAIPLNLGKLHFYAMVHAGHNTATTSEIFTGAQVEPEYVNVPGATAGLASIVNTLNVCSGETIEPVVKVTNTGGAITSISFSSSINGGTPVTYTYNGGISAFGSMDITLPEMYFTPQGSNSLSVAITSVNGGSGTVGSPATANKTILIGDEANTIQATVQVTTDRYGSETTWKIYNSSNVVVASGGPYTDAGASGAYPQPDVNFNLVASECYYVELLDAYGDGFDSGYGNGDFKVMSGTNNVVSMSTFASGGLLDDKFSTSYYLSLDENELANSVNVFPNPANDDLNVKFTSVENYVVSLTDLQGRVISSKSESMNGEATVTFNVVDLAAGSYIVKINTGSNTLVRNVVVK